MTDISELFARDPLKLTQSDITALVVELRRMRENFVAGQKSAGNLKPKAVKSLTAAGAGLSLKDLGLE